MSARLLEIPVIDFEPFIQGDASVRQSIARQINLACRKIGFMYLKNPGVSPNLIEETFTQSKQFFALPIGAKNQLAWSDEMSNRGYVGVERERLDPDKPGDLKEAFNVGKEVNADGAQSFPRGKQWQNKSSLILNQWPTGIDDFRNTVLAFYQACSEAADTILQALAIALQLPESFFTRRHDEGNHTLRLLHYPPLESAPKSGQVRAGEHSDYGSITLLFQDEVGGLEVCTVEGEWIAAPSIPDTIILNTGDLMQRWTNHVFCSTKHRVMLPTDDRVQGRTTSRSRYSIAFFCHPNNDTEIACIESCLSETRPALYPPIRAGDYLLSRLRATY